MDVGSITPQLGQMTNVLNLRAKILIPDVMVSLRVGYT